MSGTGNINKDFKTKYSDETIRRMIDDAQGKKFEEANARHICALALTAYNEMIDTRWARYYTDFGGAEVYFVEPDEREE